jgi:hypothetical protein
MSRNKQILDLYRGLEGARALVGSPLKPWTDDASEILGPFWSKIRKRH